MIYFDQAAAMMPEPEVLDFYRSTAAQYFANQEAGHRAGYQLRRMLEDAEKRLLCALDADPEMKVLWADSGSTLFHLFSHLPEWASGAIVTDAFSHPALAAALRRTSAEVLHTFESSKRIVLEAHTAVQSETGAWNSCTAHRIPLLLDTIQSAGKFAMPDADFLTVSGHKLGAPGGAALLYRDPTGERTRAFVQMRHTHYLTGRPEPAQIFAMVFAAERWQEKRAARLQTVTAINTFLRQELPEIRLPGRKFPQMTLPQEKTSPYILHFLLPGMQSGVMVRMLSEAEIFIASGSACQAETDEPSPALLAMGYSRADAYSGIRLSFGPSNTLQEAEEFCRIFARMVQDY